MESKMKLDNWSIVSNPISPYQAPETAGKRLHGKVQGSSQFKDGTEITTSVIISIDGGKAKTASGSEYVLGTIDPDYLTLYPAAELLVV